jgi:hypothetical protein
MKTGFKTFLCAGISLLFIILPSGGCSSGNGTGSNIFNATILGAVVGGVVGHQSDETDAGIAVGAGLFAAGALLSELDSASHPKDIEKPESQVRYSPISETYIIDVHNLNGSITPVEIKKKGDAYIGPEGEQYKELPSEEQLRPTYGMK